MAQQAQITGTVEYRMGDGTTATIRRGPVQVQAGDIDVTLSWVDDAAHCATAMPISDFDTYVARGAIELRER
jgi:hypothetical protein